MDLKRKAVNTKCSRIIVEETESAKGQVICLRLGARSPAPQLNEDNSVASLLPTYPSFVSFFLSSYSKQHLLGISIYGELHIRNFFLLSILDPSL